MKKPRETPIFNEYPPGNTEKELDGKIEVGLGREKGKENKCCKAVKKTGKIIIIIWSVL